MRIMILFFALFSLIGSLSYAESAYDLNTIIIQASRSQKIYADTTRPVSVITAEDIIVSPAKSLPELLGNQVGIYGKQYGNIKNSFVDIRGSGENSLTNILVLVDGRRTNQIDLSGQDWAQIDLASIERVEIIRGSGTVLYGDNAISGVINIITKRGQTNSKPQVSLSSEFGSYQSSKQGVELSGGFSKGGYQFNYTHEDTTGYRAQSDYWANDYNTHLFTDLTDDLSIDFQQGFHYDRYELPGALFPSNIRAFGRQGVRASINNDHGWTSDAHFGITPQLKFDWGSSDGEFSLLSNTRKRNNKFFTGSTVYEAQYETNSYEFQPKVVLFTPLTEDLDNKITGGYDYFYAKSGRRSGFLGPSQDLLFVSKITHGIYLLDEVTFNDQWLFNAGVRSTWAEYDFDQRQVVANRSSASPAVQGYEGGVGYKYNPDSKIYMSYSRSYRLPATDEFFQNRYDFGGGFSGGGFNSNLTYQKGHQYEMGIKDHTFKDVDMGINFFLAQNKNEFYLEPSTPINSNYNGQTRHYGFETEFAVDLYQRKVTPFINWTVQEAEVRQGTYAGRDIPFVPDQLFNAGFTLRPLEGLSSSLTMNYTGERFVISDVNNTQPKLKRYTTVDWSATYGFKNIEVWFSLRNLFDKEYHAYAVYSPFANDTGFYPAPTRNVSAGMKVKF